MDVFCTLYSVFTFLQYLLIISNQQDKKRPGNEHPENRNWRIGAATEKL